jgi:nitrite reductase/ring-hydroxylating ferredoxin subunit
MSSDGNAKPGMDRRTFLKLSGGALGALALFRSPMAFGAEPNWVEVGSEADFPLEQPVFFKDQRVFVIRRSEGMKGLSARCTHRRSCTVAWSGQEFVCPCHRARFDISGAVLAGPARNDLVGMSVKIEGGRVWFGPEMPRG